LSTLPPGFDHPSLAAEVRVDPAGTTVYVSNRGHDSIASFTFSDGTLDVLTIVPSRGRGPRNFALHPVGDSLVVANQYSNLVSRFAIAPGTGSGTQPDESHEVVEPVCVTFVEVTP
jgi:6-phosphogluconolactonase